MKSTFFIHDLHKDDPRRSQSGVAGSGRNLSPLLAEAVLHQAYAHLNRLIQTGEAAHSSRDRASLWRVGQQIITLDLGGRIDLVGKYYQAQSLNRLGPEAIPRANKLLEEVADQGPGPYRSKAILALGTNLSCSGDSSMAGLLYADAERIASSLPSGGRDQLFLISMQKASFKYLDGDLEGALRDFRELRPSEAHLRSSQIALLHAYFNNLVVVLMANRRIAEADHFSMILRKSPYLDAYPEWRATLLALDTTDAHQASRGVVSVSPPSAGRAEERQSLSLPLDRNIDFLPLPNSEDAPPPRDLALTAWNLAQLPDQQHEIARDDCPPVAPADVSPLDSTPAEFDHLPVEAESSSPAFTGTAPLPAPKTFRFLSTLQRAIANHARQRLPNKLALRARGATTRSVQTGRAARSTLAQTSSASSAPCLNRLSFRGVRIPLARAPPLSPPADQPEIANP